MAPVDKQPEQADEPDAGSSALLEWFELLRQFKVQAIVVLGPDPCELRAGRQVAALHPKSFAGEAAALARSDSYGVEWRSTDSPLAAWRHLSSRLAEEAEWAQAWLRRGAMFMVRIDFPTAFSQGYECFVFCGAPSLDVDAVKHIAYSALGAWPMIRREIVATAYGITPRELQVLVAVAEGLSTKEVADRIGVAERTVAYHLQHVQTKLGAPNRPAMIQRACSLGLW